MKAIYLDLDGVMVNWDKAAMTLFGYEGPATEWNYLNKLVADEMNISQREAATYVWQHIEEQGAEWWASMELYPYALDLYRRLWAAAPVVFVTSPTLAPSSAAGKVMWLARNAPVLQDARENLRRQLSADNTQYWVKRVARCYSIAPAKAMLAAPDKLLIDDREGNCDRFEAAGGSALLWPQPWNHLGRDCTPQELEVAQRKTVNKAQAWARE